MCQTPSYEQEGVFQRSENHIERDGTYQETHCDDCEIHSDSQEISQRSPSLVSGSTTSSVPCDKYFSLTPTHEPEWTTLSASVPPTLQLLLFSPACILSTTSLCPGC